MVCLKRLRRIDRILKMIERYLGRLLDEPLDDVIFENVYAFRWDRKFGNGALTPIENLLQFDLKDLKGVDRSLDRLTMNTEQFLRGFPSNNVLLYGERGTGKSSSVRGLLSRFGREGLRIVEVDKADLVNLPSVLSAIRNHPYRFLLFCDDFSFDEGEPGYRELKAALEGSLEALPENVRIIATSNRRNLFAAGYDDNKQVRLDESGELRLGDSLEEKLALSDRFGLALGFFSFNQDTYLEIVKHYTDQAGIEIEKSILRSEALRWSLNRSSRSGRTAKQFVDDLSGRIALGDRPCDGFRSHSQDSSDSQE